LVSGDFEVRQRLERRLLTRVNGYVWHKEYGAGLPQKIGTVLSIEDIEAVCAAQLALEASVAPTPPTKLTVAASPNDPSNIGIGVVYWDAQTGIAVSFTIAASTTS
jgi:hypothetical protein